MDFMAGGDLVRLLEHYEFSEMHVQFYAAECINGINAIHKFGYIHRDIKPDNVLLDNKGHVKIGDFGTCIQMIKNDDGVQTNKCKFSTGPGTMDYVSPEVLENATKRQMSVYARWLKLELYSIIEFNLWVMIFWKFLDVFVRIFTFLSVFVRFCTFSVNRISTIFMVLKSIGGASES